MDELLELARENNTMLQKICAYVEKVDSAQHRDNEDMRNMAINLIADLLVDRFGNRNNDNFNNFRR